MTAAGCPEDAAKEEERKLAVPDDSPSKPRKETKPDPSGSTENNAICDRQP